MRLRGTSGVSAFAQKSRHADKTVRKQVPVGHQRDNRPVTGAENALEPAEERLLQRLRNGDSNAFTELVTSNTPGLVRLAQSYVPSLSVAEEVAQETWLAVVNGLAKFEGRSSLRTWIYRILTNRAKTRGVRERRGVPFSALDELDPSELSPNSTSFQSDGSWMQPPSPWAISTPEDLVHTRETLQHLEKALGNLPTTQRAVVTLRDLEGLSSDEVCNILDLSETNQRVLLHRGRTKLRAALAAALTDPP